MVVTTRRRSANAAALKDISNAAPRKVGGAAKAQRTRRSRGAGSSASASADAAVGAPAETLGEADRADAHDPQAVVPYIGTIYNHLRESEVRAPLSDPLPAGRNPLGPTHRARHTAQGRHVASENYMETQKDVNEKMRAILVDWLIEVHHKFKLVPETMYTTVNLIDRYLETQVRGGGSAPGARRPDRVFPTRRAHPRAPRARRSDGPTCSSSA